MTTWPWPSPRLRQTAEAYCGRAFCKETLVDTFRIEGMAASRLLLSRRPVVSIASVVEDGITLATSQYEVDPISGLLLRLDDNDQPGFWASPAKTVVTYTAGFVLPGNDGRTLPDDVEAAAIEAVRTAGTAAPATRWSRARATPGVYEVTYWVAARREWRSAARGGGQVGALHRPYRLAAR